MADALEIALVAGGSAVAGSLATGFFQLRAVSLRWRLDKAQTEAEAKADLYADYLDFLLQIPLEIEYGVIEGQPDADERLRKLARRNSAFQAALSLRASAAVRERLELLKSSFHDFNSRKRCAFSSGVSATA
jgi:hypothetical protein